MTTPAPTGQTPSDHEIRAATDTAIVMGYDALRMCLGSQPVRHTVESVFMWLRAMHPEARDTNDELTAALARIADLDARNKALEKERDEATQLNKLWKEHDDANLESDSIVASCGCLTKTNEVRFHKLGCKYRLISERDEARQQLAALTEKLAQSDDAHDQMEMMANQINLELAVANSAVSETTDNLLRCSRERDAAFALVTETKGQIEDLKKQRAGAMHSSENWELMHAKRHEELERMTAERDALAAALKESLKLSATMLDGGDFDKLDEWEAVARAALSAVPSDGKEMP